jgi:hypothetical protein
LRGVVDCGPKGAPDDSRAAADKTKKRRDANFFEALRYLGTAQLLNQACKVCGSRVSLPS